MTTPTEKELTGFIDELVVHLVREADAKAGFKDVLETFKEKHGEYVETSWVAMAAKEKYNQDHNPEGYERKRMKIEGVYEILDNL